MKIFDEDSQDIEQALKESYHAKEQIEVGSRWKMDAMRQIRQAGPLNNTWSFFIAQFGLRFAAAVGMILVVVSVYAGLSGFNPIEELASLLFMNPVELTVAQMFL
jgi:hypothetical protein